MIHRNIFYGHSQVTFFNLYPLWEASKRERERERKTCEKWEENDWNFILFNLVNEQTH
jgi:hypothetical protein